MVTLRTPAGDFGVPAIALAPGPDDAAPHVQHAVRQVNVARGAARPAPRTAARTTRPAAPSAGAWSGMASAITSSSASVAGRISLAVLACPAPRMRHGLAAIRSSATAVFRMARSSP